MHRILDTLFSWSKERERRSVHPVTTDSMTPLERERDPSHKEVGRSFVLLSQKKHKKNTHTTRTKKKTHKKIAFSFAFSFSTKKKTTFE